MSGFYQIFRDTDSLVRPSAKDKAQLSQWQTKGYSQRQNAISISCADCEDIQSIQGAQACITRKQRFSREPTLKSSNKFWQGNSRSRADYYFRITKSIFIDSISFLKNWFWLKIGMNGQFFLVLDQFFGTFFKTQFLYSSAESSIFQQSIFYSIFPSIFESTIWNYPLNRSLENRL